MLVLGTHNSPLVLRYLPTRLSKADRFARGVPRFETLDSRGLRVQGLWPAPAAVRLGGYRLLIQQPSDYRLSAGPYGVGSRPAASRARGRQRPDKLVNQTGI